MLLQQSNAGVTIQLIGNIIILYNSYFTFCERKKKKIERSKRRNEIEKKRERKKKREDRKEKTEKRRKKEFCVCMCVYLID